MPITKRPLNSFGLWLNAELDKRNISKQEICKRLNMSQSYLCDLMRGNSASLENLAAHKERIKGIIKDLGNEQRYLGG